MTDDVKVCIVYPVFDTTTEIATTMSRSVMDVKTSIIENSWPKKLPSVQNVERLRLFVGGKEIGGREHDDRKTLRDAGLPVSQNGPTKVHVVVVLNTSTRMIRDVDGPSSAGKIAVVMGVLTMVAGIILRRRIMWCYYIFRKAC